MAASGVVGTTATSVRLPPPVLLLLLLSMQRKDGRVLIGETRPEDASNTDDSSGNAQRILDLAAAAVPALAAASIEGVWRQRGPILLL
jgi:glycine/D-amino acid oxidase-like deaminating enzyme